ncbi:SRPBCC domain-containing protein [Neisseria perflava]|uniref:SRPBCC domain-containing protein n=1 Tax=Neisseria perflava TaxID=33053 RepID=UPI00209E6ED8|nr:SRPBCC domain-containing protein [Neisseria perflava]MCP1659275.1 hypothetical protein [Neisseria perflava]MCP1772783.1 hypothetical protein [Neisseria perflava]
MSNQQPAIIWPEKYTPGETDNFASNEVIVKGLSIADVLPYLEDTRAWAIYYQDNCDNVRVGDGSQTLLSDGIPFTFDTFGFTVYAEVLEFTREEGLVRLAWKGLCGEGDGLLDVYHAWLLQDLPGNRVRILTQESQIGNPAKELAQSVPNIMVNGHQAWLKGLVETARNKVAIA